MFNVSTRVQYGFLALLALADGDGKTPVRLGSIARDLHLSFKYLENIFQSLVKARIVRGTRGPEGGYVLERDPRSLSLYDIFRALEGPVFTVECFDEESACRHLALCPVRDLWGELRGSLEKFLKRRTLADIKSKYKKPVVLAHMEMFGVAGEETGKKESASI
ncbi:MAG: Rrf2 family transcriptional regulator [Spirochaetales bacterium]|nr:Rrf2 family transcriptional regulator [Spirochaetales bacterium]